MHVTITQRKIEPDILVLKISGRLTLGRASQDVESTVDQLMAQNVAKLIFDLSELTYMDSTGLGIVAFCSGKMRKAGKHVRVAGATGTVSEMFSIAGVDKALDLVATVDDAVKSLASPPPA